MSVKEVHEVVHVANADVKADMAGLKTQMAGLETEMKTEMADNKAEIKAEMAEIRAEIKAEIKALAHAIQDQRLPSARRNTTTKDMKPGRLSEAKL